MEALMENEENLMVVNNLHRAITGCPVDGETQRKVEEYADSDEDDNGYNVGRMFIEAAVLGDNMYSVRNARSQRKRTRRKRSTRS